MQSKIAIIALALLVALSVTHIHANANMCECGAFAEKDPELATETKPFISQNPLNTTCDDAGAKVCAEMCINLVKMALDKAPELLCSHLRHSDGIQPSLFTRNCNGPWKYSGLTCEHKLCCHEGQKVACAT